MMSKEPQQAPLSSNPPVQQQLHEQLRKQAELQQAPPTEQLEARLRKQAQVDAEALIAEHLAKLKEQMEAQLRVQSKELEEHHEDAAPPIKPTGPIVYTVQKGANTFPVGILHTVTALFGFGSSRDP